MRGLRTPVSDLRKSIFTEVAKMGTTVGDLLSLQNGSFGTVKIYNRKEIFSGSVKKAMELYSKYNVVSFGTNWYEDLCIYVEID